MTVSLLEILAAARAHAAPLAAESAGYLLLAVADHAVSSPRAVSADDVELQPDGSVRLRARRGAAFADESGERSVRSLLARLLEVSSSVGPALRRASQRADDVGLAALVRELESSLIPVNRSAAKRALSRVHRETVRARDAGKLDAWLSAEADVPAPPISPAKPASVSPPPSGSVPVSAPPPAAPVSEPAELPEPSPVCLPIVVAVETPPPTRAVAPRPAVELTLTPEPFVAVGEPAFTKPEPVVLRAKQRGSSTPRLGTLVTAQTLPGEETERTERAPAAEPQPFGDPEPSCMPDVLTAMAALHTGIAADEAPTRLRDVVTELRITAPSAPIVVTSVPVVVTPEPQVVDDAWLTESSRESVAVALPEPVVSSLHEAVTWNPGPVAPGAAPLAAAPTDTERSPELSPYIPAVLPARKSDVSELLDSFYVSGERDERELRSALKEIAGLELTPMPHPLIEEG